MISYHFPFRELFHDLPCSQNLRTLNDNIHIETFSILTKLKRPLCSISNCRMILKFYNSINIISNVLKYVRSYWFYLSMCKKTFRCLRDFNILLNFENIIGCIC